MPTWKIIEIRTSPESRWLLCMPDAYEGVNSQRVCMVAVIDDDDGYEQWSAISQEDAEWYALDQTRHSLHDIDVTNVWS